MSELQQLLNSDLPLLIDFYAEWCGPCKALEPEIDHLKERLSGKVNVFKADVEKYLPEALNFEVRGVPTFVFYKNGVIVWREAGVLSGAELERRILQSI